MVLVGMCESEKAKKRDNLRSPIRPPVEKKKQPNYCCTAVDPKTFTSTAMQAEGCKDFEDMPVNSCVPRWRGLLCLSGERPPVVWVLCAKK